MWWKQNTFIIYISWVAAIFHIIFRRRLSESYCIFLSYSEPGIGGVKRVKQYIGSIRLKHTEVDVQGNLPWLDLHNYETEEFFKDQSTLQYLSRKSKREAT